MRPAEILLALNQSLRQAAEGRGRIALVSGDAGIGKTSLVECFLERRPTGVRTLWGACEGLFTLRPLGPLYGIARQGQTPLRETLESATTRAMLFEELNTQFVSDMA